MRRVIDSLIVLCVIGGATGIAMGYRWAGTSVLLLALLIGWKRDWCLESWSDMCGSSQQGRDTDDAGAAAPSAGSDASTPD